MSQLHEYQRPATKAEQDYQEENYATKGQIYSTYLVMGSLIGSIVLLGCWMLFN